MEFPHVNKLKIRFIETFLTVPKIFFGAFLWEGFSLGSKCDEYDLKFYWLSGLGCAIGTHMGHVAITFLVQRGHDFSYFHEFTKGFLYGVAVLFGPGTCWQRVVNDAHDWGFTFTQAFFYMWLISCLLFFTAMTVFRKVIEVVSIKTDNEKVWIHLRASLYHDLLISLSVGVGDAFFMGTEAVHEFPSDNWLAPAFGVHSGTNTGLAMFMSGLSTTCGFLIAQSLMNCVVKDCWTDKYDSHDTQSLLDHATLHEARLSEQQRKTETRLSEQKKYEDRLSEQRKSESTTVVKPIRRVKSDLGVELESNMVGVDLA